MKKAIKNFMVYSSLLAAAVGGTACNTIPRDKVATEINPPSQLESEVKKSEPEIRVGRLGDVPLFNILLFRDLGIYDAIAYVGEEISLDLNEITGLQNVDYCTGTTLVDEKDGKITYTPEESDKGERLLIPITTYKGEVDCYGPKKPGTVLGFFDIYLHIKKEKE